ncbi:major facilitator superfamily domain-containing protein [Podospora appendiculata]|uniref:Major facilitator superfamily domain-containing protein n=1 Tax=Podospora appendiculata TaxID=314037 RepID=A0AAE0XDJ2_9PEZI|nr:major facilitator superfamily domain-containing protein [Podospora appendiculata]
MSIKDPNSENFKSGGNTSTASDYVTPEKDIGDSPTEDDGMPDFGKAPDGGIVAWLVAAGAGCLFFAALGFSNSFGVFQEYYMTHQLQDESADKIAWIGSVSAFLQFGTGAVAGPLFDRYGARVIRPAAIAYVSGIMMMSLCSKYWQLMLTQGLLMGVSMGLLTLPAMASVSQFFDKKRAAALGIAVSGSSIGGIVFPILLAKMLHGSSLGFGWSVRLTGFIIVPFMLFACATIRARLPARTTTFFIGRAWKEPRFTFLVASTFCMFLGMFTPLFFVPTYAVSRGMDATLASYLLAIVNGASTFGRVIPGILADKYGRMNIFALAGLLTGLITLCMTNAESTAGLIVYCIFIGFSSGTIISGCSAAFTGCSRDPREIGTYIGMGMAVGAIAVLIGPPINGALVAKYGGYLQMTIFSGVMCLTGGFIALASKLTTPEGITGRV